MSAVSWKTLARLGHETRCDAVFAADALCGEFEEGGFVCHVSYFAEVEGLELVLDISLALLDYGWQQLTASKTPGPLSVCQPSIPQLKASHASKTW